MNFIKVVFLDKNKFIYLNKVEINRFLLLYVDNREFKLIKLLVKDNF